MKSQRVLLCIKEPNGCISGSEVEGAVSWLAVVESHTGVVISASAILTKSTLRAIDGVLWLLGRYCSSLNPGYTLSGKMLSAAQLLDELMGRDRNLAPDEKRSNVRWDDESVS